MNNIHVIISSLRNGGLAKRLFVSVPLSNFNIKFLDVLYFEGFILGYSINHSSKIVKVFICYAGHELPLVCSLRCISKPGFKRYLKYSELIQFYFSQFLILSTNKGLLTGTQAIRNKCGGEFVCLRYYFLFNKID